ncbi:MAG TPA: FliM/FliN family flagellar motor switch protein [Myxococcota bacterium]|nr:FliM/FliN family flagellar motor switch protein [Myxococcota bacterium]HRY92524.1 FliM/FliN family flagellar motor switch protein [Myxococcota bacterium]
MSEPRVRPFPRARLPRVARAELALAARLAPGRWLPGLARGVARLAERLGLEPPDLRVTRLQALPVEDLRAAFPGGARFAVLVEPARGRLGCLALDARLVARVEARLPPRTAEPARADEGLAAGLVCAGLQALADLEPAWAGWRLAGLLEGAGALGRLLGNEVCLAGAWLEVRLGATHGSAAWLEGEGSLARRPELCAADPPPAGPGWPGWIMRLPAAAARRLGTVELRAAELAALAPGDVLLLADAEEPDGIRLQLGGQALRGRREAPGRLRLEWLGWDETGGEDMQTASDDQAVRVAQAAPGGLQVGELPVRVVVEAGRLQLPVALLARLRVGDVLTFPEPVLGPVELRAGGRLLGRGELVDVEGQRGVRLLELAGAGEGDRALPG